MAASPGGLRKNGHMSAKASRDYPSPVLPAAQVRDILIEANGEAGAAGGAVGGAIGGAAHGPLAGAAGAAGGRSGGRTGGRLGARLFTKVTGQGRTVAVRDEAAALSLIAGSLRQVLPTGPTGSHPGAGAQVVIGVVGTGVMNMNTAVIQAVGHPGRVEVTAHALEGLVSQRSAVTALDRIEQALTGG